MEWQYIVSFHAIVRFGNITKAAEATFRTQSALSQQLAKLEEELNCKLLHRIGKTGFRLTSEGEAFYKFVEDTLQRTQQLQDKLADLAGKNTGSIRLAAPYGVMYFLLADILHEYTRAHPNVALKMMHKTPQESVDMVIHGDLDFCVTHQSSIPHSIHSIPWKTGHFMLATPKGHPLGKLAEIRPEDLVQYPLNLPEKNVKLSARVKLDRIFEEYGLKYQIALETPNVLLSLRYTMMGIGISFMLCYPQMIKEFSDRLDFIPMHHLFPDETIAIGIRKDCWQPAYKKEFFKYLLNKK